MIQLDRVTKVFQSPGGERLTVLDEVSLDLPSGRSVAIQGPSGSGKSTLLGLMAGLERPTAGRVIVDGEDLAALDQRALSRFRARKLGFVFQAFHLLQPFSALQNVVIAAEIAGVADPEARAREALARVGLAERLGHLPAQLSGGECQRVALARAVVARPPILLCDEPTGSLDPRNADLVFQLLLDLHRDLGNLLVLVTHDAHLAARLDRQVTLERGRVQRPGQISAGVEA
ncbi:MAG TPA: ABC transporter ATP-binding protein [Holophagaceae bacterium]|nr:ABC transporter ATP-binding protein [Holophagaceae bacterium]